MNDPMRFLIRVESVDERWDVTITCPTQGNGWRYERRMLKLKKGKFVFPKPENCPLERACHSDLCSSDNVTPILNIYKKIVQRDPGCNEVAKFGCYLFECLIGQTIWNAILETAKDAPVIELALSWAKSEVNLHLLHWEMMCEPGENRSFLAAGRKKEVAITRLVAGTEATTAQPLTPPVRMFFVVGAPLTDPDIRPGAEYLGLLRQLKDKQIKRTIYSRVLLEASPRKMKRIMDHFHPDIVHIISHGKVKHGGIGHLNMELNQDEIEDYHKARHAQNLLDYLRIEPKQSDHQEWVENYYPQIVVLSACYSAGDGLKSRIPGDGLDSCIARKRLKSRIAGAHDTAPLAAELVAGGIPIVIGMSGRVSDLACRLFTRRFGSALVRGESLVMAIAQGRRAAFGEGVNPETSVDWAFPVVFMAEGVSSNYIPTPRTDQDPSVTIEQWVQSYNLAVNPIFCGRHQLFEDYYQLIEGSDKSVLAIGGETGLGKTRLLQELTARAIRDGHIPCLLKVGHPGNSTVPRNPTEFAMAMLEVIGDVRKIYDLDPPFHGDLLTFLNPKKSSPDLERPKNIPDNKKWINFYNELSLIKILHELHEIQALGAKLVHELLKEQFALLLRDAQQKHPFLRDKKKRVIVFIDDVHEYDTFLKTLLDKMLGAPGSYGFGTNEQPVPVILTFPLRSPATVMIKDTEQLSWLMRSDLKLFSKEEEKMAYERVLMNPFSKIMEGISDVELTITDDEDMRSNEAIFQSFFHKEIKFNPSSFDMSNIEKVYGVAEIAKQHEYLVEANDLDILKKIAWGTG